LTWRRTICEASSQSSPALAGTEQIKLALGHHSIQRYLGSEFNRADATGDRLGIRVHANACSQLEPRGARRRSSRRRAML
jgi:hypothetical protein